MDNIYSSMGKRGPKSKFINIACPNEACKDHGVTGKGNIICNGTYQARIQQFTDISVIVAGKRSVIVLILLTTIFAKTNLPLI